MEFTTFYNQLHRRFPQRELPEGWISWKGTDICMDLLCECGHDEHLDAEGQYYWRCPACNRSYAIGPYVKLVQLTNEEIAFIKDRGDVF